MLTVCQIDARECIQKPVAVVLQEGAVFDPLLVDLCRNAPSPPPPPSKSFPHLMLKRLACRCRLSRSVQVDNNHSSRNPQRMLCHSGRARGENTPPPRLPIVRGQNEQRSEFRPDHRHASGGGIKAARRDQRIRMRPFQPQALLIPAEWVKGVE